jgi:DNA polymerase III epsilon subunit-like protein
MQNFLPDKFMICDIESTHKIISCAEILTISFIKTDLKFNVIDKRTWNMSPLYWNIEHDAASIEAHKITRDEAMTFPNKKETLREVFKWFNNERFIFAGHFNRDLFGMKVSYDYALLKQEFLDQSVEAYFRFCQIFPRQFICSTHSIADVGHKNGLIHVPLELKEGNKKASRDFSLKNICKVMKIDFDVDQYHGSEYDTEKTFELLRKFSEIMDIFEVINNDWRNENEQSDYSRETGKSSGIELHEFWNGGSEVLSGNIEDLD